MYTHIHSRSSLQRWPLGFLGPVVTERNASRFAIQAFLNKTQWPGRAKSRVFCSEFVL